MKLVAIGFALCALALGVFVTWSELSSAQPNFLSLGSFIVLTLILIVLVWYAYDTNSIARVTHERWMRDGVLNTTYHLEIRGQKGDSGRTFFQLHNLSTLLVRARVNFNLKVYGESVKAGPLYDGEDVWLLFPQQGSQGWFEIESLLQKKGKDVATMMRESTSGNRRDQLTMVLEIEFWDERCARRKLPGRHHYFDFDRWLWIPQLADPTKV